MVLDTVISIDSPSSPFTKNEAPNAVNTVLPIVKTPPVTEAIVGLIDTLKPFICSLNVVLLFLYPFFSSHSFTGL